MHCCLGKVTVSRSSRTGISLVKSAAKVAVIYNTSVGLSSGGFTVFFFFVGVAGHVMQLE